MVTDGMKFFSFFHYVSPRANSQPNAPITHSRYLRSTVNMGWGGGITMYLTG